MGNRNTLKDHLKLLPRSQNIPYYTRKPEKKKKERKKVFPVLNLLIDLDSRNDTVYWGLHKNAEN